MLVTGAALTPWHGVLKLSCEEPPSSWSLPCTKILQAASAVLLQPCCLIFVYIVLSQMQRGLWQLFPKTHLTMRSQGTSSLKVSWVTLFPWWILLFSIWITIQCIFKFFLIWHFGALVTLFVAVSTCCISPLVVYKCFHNLLRYTILFYPLLMKNI